MHRPSCARLFSSSVLLLTLVSRPAWSQNSDQAAAIAADKALLAKETYQAPPPEIAKLVTAPATSQRVARRSEPRQTALLEAGKRTGFPA